MYLTGMSNNDVIEPYLATVKEIREKSPDYAVGFPTTPDDVYTLAFVGYTEGGTMRKKFLRKKISHRTIR